MPPLQACDAVSQTLQTGPVQTIDEKGTKQNTTTTTKTTMTQTTTETPDQIRVN